MPYIGSEAYGEAEKSERIPWSAAHMKCYGRASMTTFMRRYVQTTSLGLLLMGCGGQFPLWRFSYSIIHYIRMKFERHRLGFQNLYNIPQGMEVPRLTYQKFSNLIGNITDMVIAEQN